MSTAVRAASARAVDATSEWHSRARAATRAISTRDLRGVRGNPSTSGRLTRQQNIPICSVFHTAGSFAADQRGALRLDEPTVRDNAGRVVDGKPVREDLVPGSSSAHTI